MKRCSICKTTLDDNLDLCPTCGEKLETANSNKETALNENNTLIPKLKQLVPISTTTNKDSSIDIISEDIYVDNDSLPVTHVISATTSATIAVKGDKFKPLKPLHNNECTAANENNDTDIVTNQDENTTINNSTHVKPHIGKLPPAFLLKPDEVVETQTSENTMDSIEDSFTNTTNNSIDINADAYDKEFIGNLTEDSLYKDDSSSDNLIITKNELPHPHIAETRPLSELLNLQDSVSNYNDKSTIDIIEQPNSNSIPLIENDNDTVPTTKLKPLVPLSDSVAVQSTNTIADNETITEDIELKDSDIGHEPINNTSSSQEGTAFNTNDILDIELETTVRNEPTLTKTLSPLKPVVNVISSNTEENTNKLIKVSSISTPLKPLSTLKSKSAAPLDTTSDVDTISFSNKEEMEKGKDNIVESITELKENETPLQHISVISASDSSYGMNSSTIDMAKKHGYNVNVLNLDATEEQEIDNSEQIVETATASETNTAADNETIELNPDKILKDLEEQTQEKESETDKPIQEEIENIFNTNADGYYNDAVLDEPIPTTNFPAKKILLASFALVILVILFYLYALYFIA